MTSLEWIDELITRNPSECVMWPFAPGSDNYGRIYYDGKTWQANRFVCQRAHGAPPFPEWLATHECGIIGCVTPNHLVWGSHSKNNHDKHYHGTVPFGTKSGTSNLTEDDVHEIRRLLGTMPQERIAWQFGISQGAVSRIKRRATWDHI